ncbi:uncharacterized protein LOC133891147 [Phragmites australis]|uniref:uncharacterized protein LOC133891147 n=1 Tax=Phragmites australis TaxID=29695 RepID=UPI002D79AA84|nr:uncharacterized protein LOC133891147 [Phragmites australis]
MGFYGWNRCQNLRDGRNPGCCIMFPQHLQSSGSDEPPPPSWIREMLISMDHASRSYTYLMEDGNVSLTGSRNTVSLFDYGGGDDSGTLVVWNFEIDPVDGANEDALLDYHRILYKSCIDTIPCAINFLVTSINFLVDLS